MEKAELQRREADLQSSSLRQQLVQRHICSNSKEIQDLQKKFENAYVSREIHLQLQQRRLEDEIEKQHQVQLGIEMSRQAENWKIEEDKKQAELMEQSLRYQQDLEKQLEESVMKKQAEYEQFLLDKAAIDLLVRKIIEEDER